MKKLFFLNSREKKEIIKQLDNQFGFNKTLDYTFVRTDEDELFLVSKDVDQLNLEQLRIKQIGLKFAKEIRTKQSSKKGFQLLLTAEGSQIIGKDCTKNIVEVGNFQLKKWFSGKDIEIFLENEDIYLIKAKNKDLSSKKDDFYFIGCAKYRENRLINSLPTDRRQEII